MRHNSAAPDAFAKAVKVTTHTGLWDAEHSWYSPNATQQNCLFGLERSLGIHSFRLTWLAWLLNQAKFLKSYGYFSVINCQPSQLELQNILTASLQSGKTLPLPMSVLDMKVKLQSWSFGEYRIPFYCHCSQVHSYLKW